MKSFFALSVTFGVVVVLVVGCNATQEVELQPIHVTVVGSKKDPLAKELFDEAKKSASRSSRIEWLDPSESPPPHSGFRFPHLKSAAAFICTGKQCSLPMTTVVQLRRKIELLAQQVDTFTGFYPGLFNRGSKL